MTENKEIEGLKSRPAYVIACIAGLVAISTSIIAFSDDESKVFWGNLTIGAASAASAGVGLLLLSKIRTARPESRAFSFLVTALLLWLAAWLLWSYYELGLGVEPLFPSAADALWLAGYGPSIYYVAWSYRLASSSLQERRLISTFLATIITSIIMAVFLFPIIDYTLDAGGDWPALAVGISYPILDGILLAMAILTLVSLSPRQYHFVPSVMIMTAILAAVIADTGFGYGVTAGVQVLQESRIWDALYTVAYLCIAGALYWHYHAIRKV